MNKRIAAHILLLSALATGAASCKKGDSNNTTCRIITMTDVSSSGTTTINLTYNNDGKISTLAEAGAFTSNKVFTYTSNTIIISQTGSGGSFSGRDSVTLNGSGQAINRRHYNNAAGTSWTNDVFSYDNSGHVIKDISTSSSGGTPSTTIYNYTNGDMTSAVTSGSSSDTATVEYYTDKASQDGDYFYISGIIEYGFQLIKNAHLSKNIFSGSSIINLSYSFNSNNQISQITYTSGSSVENLTYQYQCN